MVLKLKARVDDREFRKLVKEFAKQVPFATAVALTKTAAQLIPEARKSLSKNLDVTNRGLPRAAFHQRRSVVKAKKTDFPRSRAIVGVPDDAKFRGKFLADHVVGRRRKARGNHPGARRIAIPTKLVKRLKKGTVSSTQRPGVIMRKPRGFLDESHRGKGPVIGLNRGRRRRDGRTIYYLLRRSVRIRKQWPFGKEMKRAAKTKYSKNFETEFRKAVVSARKRAARRAATTQTI